MHTAVLQPDFWTMSTDVIVRMPAEWEPHAATWITWPHCEETWPGRLHEVIPAYIEMIRALATSETVYVNTLSDDHRKSVEQILADHGIDCGPRSPIRLLVLPTDDEWIRDYGALIVREGTELLATDWQFNAWGNKYDRVELNNRVPALMSRELAVRSREFPMVLEGGAIDVNGNGLCLTTESCLLNANRNPSMSRSEIEAALLEGLGVEDTIWLSDGIEGDDTDGHIDDLARFVAPDTVAVAVEHDQSDVNYAILQENLDRLKAYRMSDDGKLALIEVPMPSPVLYQGQRLPASYMNFYIANQVVLVPVFGCEQDDVAANALQDCFPTREIAPIDSRALIWGFGSCHCLTQQVPRQYDS